MEPECICANRAKVESIVHPYCPRHAGGDPGPGIGVCQGPGCNTSADVIIGDGGAMTRLCTSCLLTAYLGAMEVIRVKDKELAAVTAERDALVTALEGTGDSRDEWRDRAMSAESALAHIAEWTLVFGVDLCPYAPWTDSFGDGMRAAKAQVSGRLDAFRASQQQTPPLAPQGTGLDNGVPPSRGEIGGPSGFTFEDALHIARGCTDYGGGYSGASYDIYQHGIGTVITALERANRDDTQTAALLWMGEKQTGGDDA